MLHDEVSPDPGMIDRFRQWITEASKSQFRQNVIWFTALSGFERALALVQTALISNALGITEYGVYGLLCVAIGYVASNAAFQLGLTATVFVSKYRETEKAKAAGVIAVVSPQMPLSIGNLRSVREIANSYGLALTVLTDPHVADARFARNASRTLALRGSLLHYPTVHTYLGGVLDPRVIYGAKSVESYQSLLRQLVESSPTASRTGSEAGCVGLDPLRRRGESRLARISGFASRQVRSPTAASSCGVCRECRPRPPHT